MGLHSFIDRVTSTLKKWEAEAAERQAAEEASQREALNAAADLFVNGRGAGFHCSDRQFERFQRACSDNQIGKIVSFDNKKMRCKIRSSVDASKIYNVTLNSCDCEDFSKSALGLPCKHIYRLALELGIVDRDWDISGIPPELRQRIDALPFNDRVKFVKLIEIGCNCDFEVKKSAVPASCIESGLICESSDYYAILDENYNKNDIIAALAVAKNEYTPTSKSTKREMIQWIIDNDAKLLRKLCNKHYYISFGLDVMQCREYIYREYRYLSE